MALVSSSIIIRACNLFKCYEIKKKKIIHLGKKVGTLEVDTSFSPFQIVHKKIVTIGYITD